jgi:hypothetical protein
MGKRQVVIVGENHSSNNAQFYCVDLVNGLEEGGLKVAFAYEALTFNTQSGGLGIIDQFAKEEQFTVQFTKKCKNMLDGGLLFSCDESRHNNSNDKTSNEAVYRRNKIMAKNVEKFTTETNIDVVVLLVGDRHGAGIKEELESMGVEVIHARYKNGGFLSFNQMNVNSVSQLVRSRVESASRLSQDAKQQNQFAGTQFGSQSNCVPAKRNLPLEQCTDNARRIRYT